MHLLFQILNDDDCNKYVEEDKDGITIGSVNDG
jgi:hypothetical protein